MKSLKNAESPEGLRRRFFRIPIMACPLRLRWVFDERLVLLHHVGRISGKRRQVVLQVVEHDSSDGSLIVASPGGRDAAWYQNVLQTPEVTVRARRHADPAIALPLVEEEGADILARYASQHPRPAKRSLIQMIGYSADGSEADLREVGRRMPFVRLVPRPVDPNERGDSAVRHRLGG